MFAISIRNEDTRNMLHENVLQPILSRVSSEDKQAKVLTDLIHHKDSHGERNKPGWKFQNFDISKWNESQSVDLIDDNRVYFK